MRKAFYSLICWWGTVWVESKPWRVCGGLSGPLPLFVSPFQLNSVLLNVPKATSWHPEQLSEGQAGRWSPKSRSALQAPTIKRPSRCGGNRGGASCSDDTLIKSILEDWLGFDTLGCDSNASTRLHLPAKGWAHAFHTDCEEKKKKKRTALSCLAADPTLKMNLQIISMKRP